MRFLKKIDAGRRAEILNMLASPILFPKIHGFIRELCSGVNMKSPSENVQLKNIDPLIPDVQHRSERQQIRTV
jgi:hypothetical protein